MISHNLIQLQQVIGSFIW